MSGAFLGTFLIVFREALEAGLIVGIIYVVLERLKATQFRSHVFVSVLVALFISLFLGFGLMNAAESIQGTSKKAIEGFVSLIACGVLTYMIFWMSEQSRKMKTDIETKLESAISNKEYFAFISLPFLAIFREGAETVLFLGAMYMKDPLLVSLWGGVSGGILAVIVAIAIFVYGKKIPIKVFFQSTGILLMLIAAGLLAYGVHELQELKLIPELVYPVWNINHILNEKEGIGSFLKALFGYNGNPSLIEVIAYGGYYIIVFSLLKRKKVEN